MKNKRITNMKSKKSARRMICAAVLSTAFLLTLAPASRATNLIFTVTLNTASLVGNLDAPFGLDVQLVQGSGNVTNTVTLGAFSFTGGPGLDASSIYSAGGVAGSFSSGSLTLTNSSSNNEYAENFGAGVTQIKFSVTASINSEVVGNGTPVMDQFNVYIDDGNTADGFVPTTAPGNPGSDALVQLNLASTDQVSSIQAFNSTAGGPDPGVITTVPEPGSTAMLCIGGFGLLAWRFKNRRAAAM